MVVKGFWRKIIAKMCRCDFCCPDPLIVVNTRPMPKIVDTPMNALKRLISECGSQAKAADRLKIKPQYLCDILHKRRDFSANVAGKLGFRQEWVVKVTTGSATSVMR